MEIGGARVLVVGMARSGIAAARLLRAQGALVTATDSRSLGELKGVSAELESIGAVFVSQSGDVARGHALVVISPGVPIDAEPLENARRMGIPVTGEIELASYFLRGPVCAITGSNGKTTTTSLVGHILRESGIAVQVGGNIGTAPASMVETSRDDQWNVLEVSSFQLEAVSHFRARIGVCLNITEDHLDRHGSMAVYEAAKGRLFETQDEYGFAVLNADDPACVRYAALGPGKPLWFSLSNPVTPGVWLQFHEILFDGEKLMDSREIPLRGLHNVQNVLAAAGAARLAGASLAQISAAVRTFPGVEHRLEFVRKLDGVEYFNDSKATNVDATLKAIDAFAGGLWIILGGKDKGSDYAPLREPLRAKAKAALLVGAAAPKIARAIEGAAPLVASGTIAQALDHARRHARAGDVVLLAPACASFDQFENFEHRGRVFKQLVEEL
ncbi:MAG: UDP-N-acetylmuramoyl-L-alanine--D-glutamate ligase [Bryobacteraceae bacterium]